MTDTLQILQNPAVARRTSQATHQALAHRAGVPSGKRFLPPAAFTLLEQIVDATLPQDAIGTAVNIAAIIDARLEEGTNAGWRFADLPIDGEAYRQGLTVFADMLRQTPFKTFLRMLPSAREGYLRCVANGEVDAVAKFPLAKWLLMVRTDAVRVWLAHPSTMHAIDYYGFADGETGMTDGPTESEGWQAVTPDKALPFEQAATTPQGAPKA